MKLSMIPLIPCNQRIEKNNAGNEEDDTANKAQYITAMKARGDKEERAHHEKNPTPQVEPHLSFSVIIGHGTDL
jgi:hypothetical protein